MTTEPNFDHLSERLRERITEPRDDYERSACGNCEVHLTDEDYENQACTNCGYALGESK